jgi:GAF domain-containing protein
VSEERDRYAALQASLNREISGAASFTTAATTVLETICQELKWDVGCVWQLDRPANALRFVLSWHPPHDAESEMERQSAVVTFPPAVGLPGRVLSSREPCWIRDVQGDLSFPRRSAAAVDEIRTAFGFPIGTRTGVLGVMEFFSREVRERDDDLLRVTVTIGEQFGPLLSQ